MSSRRSISSAIRSAFRKGKQAVTRAAKPSVFEPELLENRQLFAALVYPSTTVATTGIEMWSGTYVFTVTYKSDLKVARNTLDGRDIQVIAPDGSSRAAKLHTINYPGDNKRLIVRYKISAPGGVWDAADNGVYRVFVNKGQVRDLLGNPTRLKQIGTFEVSVPAFPSDLGNNGAPSHTITASSFGAIPDDDIDDTDAIQAAIDSLPTSNGTPMVTAPIGGIVLLAGGEYTLSRALMLKSCVILRGQGNQTILRNTSTDSNSAAITLYSPFSGVSNVGVQVQTLRLITDKAEGINATCDVIDLRLDSLTISSGGIAIDLHGHDIYQATLNNITVENPGSSALYLNVGRNNSAINRISGFTVKGAARVGFDSSQALIELSGHSSLGDITIQDIGASVLPLYIHGFVGSVRNMSIQTSAANLDRSRLMLLEDAVIQFDRIDGVSSSRQIVLVDTPEISVGILGVSAGSTAASSLSIDNTSHLTATNLYSPNGVGTISRSRMVYRKYFNSSSTAVPFGPSTVSRDRAPASTRIVNVFDFGARPNDGIDDTAAIQAAIDSLPIGSGIPGQGGDVGGLVVFSGGVFNTSAPIRLPSGVWLQGQGFGTSIHNETTGSTGEAVRLMGRNGFNIGAGITNLAIYTRFCDAIAADPAITNGVIDLRLYNIDLSAGRMGIDLRNVKTYHARFDTILIREPGSTGLWLGDAAGYSSDNEVIGLQVSGSVRPDYEINTAQVVLIGETRLESSWIELYGASDLPFYASGSISIRGLWNESHPAFLPDDLAMWFDNCTKVEIDKISQIQDGFKLRFTKSTGVTIGYLDAGANTVALKEVLDLDTVSRVRIDAVYMIHDAGMLDDPRLSIGGVYNKNSGLYVDTQLALTGTNLVADPNMSNVGSQVGNGWRVTFGDSFGDIQGSYTVEQTANGPRLKIVITSNPFNRHVSIEPRLNIPASAYGKRVIARYRVDGPDGTICWGERVEYQYASRVTGSLTAAASPRALSAGTAFIMILPPTVGTFYVSNVGVIIND
ncbi:MAG: hypothetical protein H7Z14_14010 [Anaerolineae bacterium]|nr:hypothetical protein [Phycisphaerae bacterium]